MIGTGGTDTIHLALSPLVIVVVVSIRGAKGGGGEKGRGQQHT